MSENKEWDNDHNREQSNWEERNQTSNQGSYGNRGDGSERDSRKGNEGNTSNRRKGESNQNSNYKNGNFGKEDSNFGYGGREYGSPYGGGGYQGNSSYYDSGSQGSNNQTSYGGSRNLYDRDYDRFDRGSANRGHYELGASNYGGNEDRGRRSNDQNPYFGSTNPRNYQGHSNQWGNDQGRNRDYGRGDSNDRSWWDRTKEEVTSWFGDDESERRKDREQKSHKGKGPRNYSRSDDRMKEDINDRLSDDPWVDASDIDVVVSSAEVTLTGNVNERSEKRRAEDIAESVSGVKHVENRLRVGKHQDDRSSQSGPAGSGSSESYASSQTSPAPKENTEETSGVRDKNKLK